MNESEKKTVSRMIYIYCHSKHGTTSSLCESCACLHAYSHSRLSKCRYGDYKPTCQRCPIHCYNPSMKLLIKEVMAYSGPRMILKHPYSSIKHLFKSLITKYK